MRDDLRYLAVYGILALAVIVTAMVFGVAVRAFFWAAGW